ncbi:hypothetical protein K430107D3_02630 [Dysosmobacter welbionis]
MLFTGQQGGGSRGMGLFRVSNDAETVKSPWDGTRRIRDFAAGHCALQLMRPCGIPLVPRSGRP